MPAKGYRKEKKNDKVLQIRLTDEDIRMANYLADCLNKSVSAYLRDIIRARYSEEIVQGKRIEVILNAY